MTELETVDGYAKIHTDSDGEWLGMEPQVGEAAFYLRTFYGGSGGAGGIARVSTREIPQFLNNIAKVAGLDVLIVPSPGDRISDTTGLAVTAADGGKVQIGHSFDFAKRLNRNQVIDLIWALANALAESAQNPNSAEVSVLALDLVQVGAVSSNYVGNGAYLKAKELIKLGYRKDPEAAVSSSHAEIFNQLVASS